MRYTYRTARYKKKSELWDKKLQIQTFLSSYLYIKMSFCARNRLSYEGDKTMTEFKFLSEQYLQVGPKISKTSTLPNICLSWMENNCPFFKRFGQWTNLPWFLTSSLGSVCTCVVVINHTNWYWLLSQYGRPVSGSLESESVTFSVTSCCALSKALNHHEGLLAAFSLTPSFRNQ